MAEWYDEYPDEREDLYDKMYKNLQEGKNADGSGKISINKPKAGEIYIHHNGIIYQVLYIANEESTNESYPETVVYQGNNGKVWTKPLNNFLEKMSKLNIKQR